MSLSQQEGSIEELSRVYSGERNKKVVEKWEKISDDFRNYTDKVRRFPHRLLHCKSLAKSSPDAQTSRPKPGRLFTIED